MRYLDVCAGISASTVAWKDLGWQTAAYSEIEAAPRAILAHQYPDTPLHGDFTTIKGDEYGSIDLLVGGTPCQDFSIAGLRAGLAGDRGNLSLQFLLLARRTGARWVVWENVPGVFSSLSHDAPDACPPQIDLDGGDGPGDGEEVVVEDEYEADESHALGCFLAGLSELGYGVAYRVLDAQFAGVPQRRRRIFAVGYLGDWRRAAAVLFERHSLSGHHPPRGEKGQIAPTIPSRSLGGGGLGTDFDCDGGLVSATVSSKWAKGSGGPSGDECQNLLAVPFDTTQITSAANYSSPKPGDPCHPLAAGAHPPAIAYAIQERAVSENPDAGPDGAGFRGDDTAYTLEARTVPQAVAFTASEQANSYAWERDVYPTLNAQVPNDSSNIQQGIRIGSAVRRLTPRECERLQGFPDDYTLVPYRKGMMADGPRYKALGNSMAVPVMRWIGERIAAVEALADAAAGDAAVRSAA